MKAICVLLVLLVSCSSIGHACQQTPSLASRLQLNSDVRKQSASESSESPLNKKEDLAYLRGGADTKLGKFVTRSTSAVVALSGLYLLIRNTGETGVIGLILAAQVGMFGEVTNVSGITSASKWWIMLTHMLYWNAKKLVDGQGPLINLSAFGMLADSVIILILQQNRSPNGSALRSFVVSHIAAALVVGMSSSWLAILKDYSMSWIVYPGILVIINDTMAYMCGQLFGKHSLLPKISPNKTWEGFIGAMLFTVALSRPLWKWLGSGTGAMNEMELYSLALYVSLVAPFGGFLASTVKRTYGYKDFGAVMPGHGGLVDRLDCQLMTAPFVYLYLQFLGGSPITRTAKSFDLPATSP